MNKEYIDKNNINVRIIIVACLLGIITSIYLTYISFSNTETTFCLSGSGCDIVNQSPYSKLLGLPVSFWGLIGYCLIFLILVFYKEKKKWLIIYLLSLGGVAFSFYLTYLEIYVIEAICSYCVISAFLIFGIFITVLYSKQFKEINLKMGKLLLISTVIFVVVYGSSYMAHSGLRSSGPASQTVIDLAKHLTNTGSSMYGSYTCTHCKTQKLLFGDAFQYINYIECNPAGENSKSELCLEKGIDGYPTWEINESIHVGTKSLKELAKLTGFKPKKQPEK